MDISSESEDELFPILNNNFSRNDTFCYDDALLITGILKAVFFEDLEKVKSLIDSGNSVNINDNTGNTPLHVAVIRNNLKIVDYLLSREEIVVNTRNFCGETPLFLAVKNGGLECTRKLIDAKVNVNLPNYEDITPLHISVNYPEITHVLIQRGANVDAVDYSGDSPLHDAITEGNLETVCMLLCYNADANLLGGNNLSPFMKAIIAENIDIQEALIEYVDDFNTMTKECNTTIKLALTHSTPYVEEIIKRGGDVNYPNSHNESSGAFFLCLRCPNATNFKLVWDNLIYNGEVETDLNLFFDYLTKDDIKKYIQVITESTNIKVAVESLTQKNNYCSFVNKFAGLNLDLNQLTKLTCYLVLSGYQVTCSDIYAIFENYGYCELIRILLYIGNNCGYKWQPNMVMPRIIFDVTCKFKDIDVLSINLTTKMLKNILEYHIRLDLLNLYVNRLRENDECLACLHQVVLLIQVPSLMELARDKTREYIVNKCKFSNSCQYYTFINYLNISAVYKKILKYEKKLYKLSCDNC